MDYIENLVTQLRTLHKFWNVKIEMTKTETIFEIGYVTDSAGVRYFLGRDKNPETAAKEAWLRLVKEFPDYE